MKGRNRKDVPTAATPAIIPMSSGRKYEPVQDPETHALGNARAEIHRMVRSPETSAKEVSAAIVRWQNEVRPVLAAAIHDEQQFDALYRAGAAELVRETDAAIETRLRNAA